MNKFKYLSIAALLLSISACTPSQQAKLEPSSSQVNAADTTNIEPVSKAVNGKVNRKGWEVSITGVKYAGQKIQGNYRTYEAAEVWTVVSVTVKNTSGKRQREDDAWFLIGLSKLVDSKGNKYDIKEMEFKYDTNLLSKPFSQGEARSVDFLFDTPKGIKADKFLISDKNLESIPFKL
ncbi:DUF4352 domain-containing protein [Nostoc sphaeroides CHAB 2801]|uniref:DUF4352 domain-containing protein n=1 Tax=Nostoc sphaeroides TaxID=446679 RepID=UPI000E4D110B|nr:DUF4352 domain-containing protein [Nostoc sphaeroides]MCC5629792.1 DUF4352 domain-containing protein [Nostoc sphaeroides CHAB 2801]